MTDELSEVDIHSKPEETLQQAQEWLSSHPEAHAQYTLQTQNGEKMWVDHEGNQVERSVARERSIIKRHLDKISSSDPDHHAQLIALAQQLPPMRPEVRVVVTIPAWNEGENIYHTLMEYAKQTDESGRRLDPDIYEINIIVNRKKGEPADNTVSEIERAKKDLAASGVCPVIHYVDVELDVPQNTVGNARRIINNLTLYRSLQRERQDDPLYIASEDADLIRVDQRAVFNLIAKLDSHPHLDAVLGVQDRYPPILMQNDYLFLMRRLSDFKKLVLAQEKYGIGQNPNAHLLWNRVFTGGWNTGFTAEAYALIGGQDPLMAWGEDLSVGIRISMARGDGKLPNTSVIGRVHTRTDSSPRRYIHSIVESTHSYGPQFSDPIVNATIRAKSIDDLLREASHLSRITPENQAEFENLVSRHYEFIRRHMPSLEDAQKAMGVILFLLGFKSASHDYVFNQDGSIEIKSFDNFIKAIEKYRDKNNGGPAVKTGPPQTVRSKSESTSQS